MALLPSFASRQRQLEEANSFVPGSVLSLDGRSPVVRVFVPGSVLLDGRIVVRKALIRESIPIRKDDL